jgi:hypothetical protein
MISFLLAHLQASINTLGLLLDIAGAWLVAWEVVRQFHGAKTRVAGGVLRTDYLGSDGTPVVDGQRAEDTQEFVFWEQKKYKRMKIGLGFLTVGFLLQLVSNWV